MAGSVDMWHHTQMGRSNPAAWDRNPVNKCLGCGRRATTAEFVWIWGTGRHANASVRGMYCLRCGSPEGEPTGADIAAAVRRSTGQGYKSTGAELG